MNLEQLHKIQRIVLFLTIIFIPISSLPKRFALYGFSSSLSNYFLLIGLLLLVYEYFRYKIEIPRKALVFVVGYCLWQWFCLLVGLIGYEYNEYLILEQIPKLAFIVDKLSAYGFAVDGVVAVKIWHFIRATKNILIFDNTIFIIIFYIWHLYKDDFNKGFQDIRNAMLVMTVMLGLYSVVELAWLKFASLEAEKVLKFINPYLYDPVVTNGWWPPLLWKGQLRSLTPEPAHFGILSIMILPFLWSTLFSAKGRKIKWYLLLFAFNVMIFATNARTAIVITLIEGLLLVLSVVFIRRKVYFKIVSTIVVVCIVSFLFNIIEFSVIKTNLMPNNNIVKQDVSVAINEMDLQESMYKYVGQNIGSLTSTKARSNGARLGHFLGSIEVIKDNWLFGVGTGLKDAYLDEKLRDNKNSEIILWGHTMRKEGVLNSSYPPLNQYTNVAVQNGLVGLALYLMPIIYLLVNIFRLKRFLTVEIICITISLFGLLCSRMATGMYMQCNAIVMGLLFCWINEMKKIKISPAS